MAIPLVYYGILTGHGSDGLDQELVDVHFPKVEKIVPVCNNLNCILMLNWHNKKDKDVEFTG